MVQYPIWKGETVKKIRVCEKEMKRLSFIFIGVVFSTISWSGCIHSPMGAHEEASSVSIKEGTAPTETIMGQPTIEEEPIKGEDAKKDERANEEMAHMEKTPVGYVKRLEKIAPEAPIETTSESRVQKKRLYEPQPVKSRRRPKPASYYSPEETASPSRGDIVLNFDDADLYEVVKTFAEMLNLNYIIPQPIKGNVTIRTKGGLRQEDILPIFYQVLDANGLTMVREGMLHKIIDSKESSRLPVRFNAGETGQNVPPDQRISIQIVKLNYISASEMITILKPFISPDGTIVAHADSNTILLVDKGLVILKALTIIDTFDVDMFEKTGHRFYPVKHVSVEELTGSLMEILKAYKRDRAGDVQVIPLPRLNMILVISADKTIFPRIEGLIYQLDQSNDEVERRIYVYFAKNGKAADLASILSSVFTGTVKEENLRKKEGVTASSSEKEKKSDEPRALFKKKENLVKEQKEGSAKEEGGNGSSTLKGEVTITPDEIRNALIIEASPSDYRTIETLLTKIDILPRQVLIEVTIAEISLEDSLSMGVLWSFDQQRNNAHTGLTSMGLGGGIADATGFNYAVNLTDKWIQALNASASTNNVNIISSPIILASDNMEAKIQIKTEYPVADTEYKLAGGDSNVVESSVQYRDTGVMLSVTPHINARGLVTMDISQEVSNPSDGVKVGGKDYPTFRNRSLSTSLTVNHAQSIVIGGLMTDDRAKGHSGIPFLIKLPFIGSLFGSTSNKTSKTELVLLITPRVINSLEDADSVTQEFKAKVALSKKK